MREDQQPKALSYFVLFNAKIDEYYRAMCNHGSRDRPFTDEVTATFPIRLFNVATILAGLDLLEPDKTALTRVGFKLLDLKLAYCYEENTTKMFNYGPALIVGNDQIEKLNPATFTLLQQIQYRVFLLSVLIETTLDLLQLIIFDDIKDAKTGKWRKAMDRISALWPVGADVDAMIMAFHDEYRSPELHKFSRVRALTSKNQWTHLHAECTTTKKFIDKLAAQLIRAPEQIYKKGTADGAQQCASADGSAATRQPRG